MSSRGSFPMKTCLTVAFALLATASIFATEGRRTALDRDTLVRSRGSNINNVLYQASCSVNNGDFTCPSGNGSCSDCANRTFVDVAPGDHGGYDKGPVRGASCGFNYQGTCTGASCVTFGPSIGVCAPPVGPPTIQYGWY